ncbi:MAG: ribosome silencing factor [Ruminococcaceae bacterium]|nr:ribosome silencing factor [Oscillospiraceae bacterium]
MKDVLPSLAEADARALAMAIADVLDAKKAKDIKVYYVKEKTVITEYFVVCSGNTGTQVQGLAGEVEYKIGERGVTPYLVEGRDNNAWILVDYSHVIVHVFSREAREFYNLDRLYEDTEVERAASED